MEHRILRIRSGVRHCCAPFNLFSLKCAGRKISVHREQNKGNLRRVAGWIRGRSLYYDRDAFARCARRRDAARHHR